MKQFRYFLVFLIFLIALPLNVFSQITLSELLRLVRNRAVHIDNIRFTDTLLKDFLNEEQEDIAVLANAVEKCYLDTVKTTSFNLPVPADFYLPNSVVLNADPNVADGRPAALKYVPQKDFNMVFSYRTGRPEQWSVFADSIRFNKKSATGTDTVTICYFAHATPMDTATDSLSIPLQYRGLLIDRVVLQCYDRIILQTPVRDSIKAEILQLEQKLLGRPVDQR